MKFVTNTSILLFQCYLKPVLYHSRHISHCEIDFVVVRFKNGRSGVEVKTTLEEEMVKLVRVRSVKDIRNADLDRRSNWRSS